MFEKDTILGLSPEVLIQFGINLAVAILVFFVGIKIAKMIEKMIVKAMDKKSVDKAVSSFTGNIVYALIYVATAIVALGQAGIETTSFVAVLGAAGLAVGLALQGSLSNFASGVLIILFRPFKSGDYVEAGGVAGVIREIQIFSTILNTPDNKFVVLPNAQVTAGPIINYSKEETRRVDLVIGVSYSADLAKTKELLIAVLESNSKVLEEPEYTVAVSELADSSVNFVVRPWVKTDDYWDVYFGLMENIKMELDKAGIEIPFPQMDIHLDKVES